MEWFVNHCIIIVFKITPSLTSVMEHGKGICFQADQWNTNGGGGGQAMA